MKVSIFLGGISIYKKYCNALVIKNSNVMVWIAFKAFFRKNSISLVHVDTEKFREMYGFRNKYEKIETQTY